MFDFPPANPIMTTSDYFDYESLFQLHLYDKQTGQEQISAGSCVYENPQQLEDSRVTIFVSTRFLPGISLSKDPVDLTLQSEDSVFFYVSSKMLLRHSDNWFGSHIPTSLQKDEIIRIPESSPVLNIILHAMYDISLSDHSPPLSALISAVENFRVYGLDPQVFIKDSKPVHTALLSYSPIYPIDVYALAGSLGLEDLAIATSSHLLSFPLSNLTDSLAARIGAVYLIRLLKLHMFRTEELKAMLVTPPYPHPETSGCNFEEQRRLSRAWMLAAAYLAWDARPNMSTDTVSGIFGSLAPALTCEACRQGLKNRVKEIVTKWSLLRLAI